MAWLDDHPPVSPQFRRPRREPISGVVVVHTAEPVMDTVGPDTGAENVAGFIARRSDPGSYHCIVDSDSAVQLVADDAEAFQVAVDGHNRHAWGVAFACRTVDLDPDANWTRAAMIHAGGEVRGFWERQGFCVEHSARWLDPAHVGALRIRHEFCRHGLPAGGLICHGTVQPADRSDAWARHPRRVELERQLIDTTTATTADPGEEDPMADIIRLVNVDGRVEFIGLNPSTHRPVVAWQGADGRLSPFSGLVPGDQPEDFVALDGERAADGRLTVTAWGRSGALWGSWQPAAGGGPWVPWFSVADLLAWVAAAQKARA